MHQRRYFLPIPLSRTFQVGLKTNDDDAHPHPVPWSSTGMRLWECSYQHADFTFGVQTNEGTVRSYQALGTATGTKTRTGSGTETALGPLQT